MQIMDDMYAREIRDLLEEQNRILMKATEKEKDNDVAIVDAYNKIMDNLNKVDRRYLAMEIRMDKLDDALGTLEGQIAKIPEFEEWWKGYNACGYQD